MTYSLSPVNVVGSEPGILMRVTIALSLLRHQSRLNTLTKRKCSLALPIQRESLESGVFAWMAIWNRVNMIVNSSLDWLSRAERRCNCYHRDSKRNRLIHVLSSCTLTTSSWLTIGRANVGVKPSLETEAKKKRVSLIWRPVSSIISMLSTAMFVDPLMATKTKLSWTGKTFLCETSRIEAANLFFGLVILVFASVALKFKIQMSSWTLLSH